MRSMLVKTFVTLILLCSALFPAMAQFETVYIGVNGLTCSQCTRTVEMRIRKLDFVADVTMNLQHTEGKIVLKKNTKADIEQIAQAVADAGFSVRYLQADFDIDNSIAISGSCFNYKGDRYIFAQVPKEPLKGVVKLTFTGKKYQPKSEVKKNGQSIDAKCGGVNGKVYHVSIIPG